MCGQRRKIRKENRDTTEDDASESSEGIEVQVIKKQKPLVSLHGLNLLDLRSIHEGIEERFE